jgi:hypothetical protein
MSKRSVLLIVFTAAALLALPFTVAAQSAAPWFGTWKANLGKSKYAVGPPPKSFVIKMEPWEGGLKQTFDLVEAQGQAVHSETVVKLDGRDYPVQGPPPPGSPATARQTLAFRRVDDRTLETVVKVDGKATVTVTAVYSADGTTNTATVTGKNPDGQTVNDTILWEKQ